MEGRSATGGRSQCLTATRDSVTNQCKNYPPARNPTPSSFPSRTQHAHMLREWHRGIGRSNTRVDTHTHACACSTREKSVCGLRKLGRYFPRANFSLTNTNRILVTLAIIYLLSSVYRISHAFCRYSPTSLGFSFFFLFFIRKYPDLSS